MHASNGGHSDDLLRELTDEQVLEQYKGGYEPALTELIERYRQELYNFLARFLNDRVAADDVFQESFLQVHISAHTFDADRRFKPWLFTIAANKGRDYMRKRRRRPAAEIDAPVRGSEGKAHAFVDLMQADLPQPDERLTDAERAERVQAAVAEMPDHLREILMLAYFQQFPYAEIAEVLEIPLGTVKSRLHTAVGTFAKIWKRMNPNDEDTY